MWGDIMEQCCKYCNSEMDLMESEIDYEIYVCMNEECRAELTICDYYSELYRWEKES